MSEIEALGLFWESLFLITEMVKVRRQTQWRRREQATPFLQKRLAEVQICGRLSCYQILIFISVTRKHQIMNKKRGREKVEEREIGIEIKTVKLRKEEESIRKRWRE
jgi:hypothetical protein